MSHLRRFTILFLITCVTLQLSAQADTICTWFNISQKGDTLVYSYRAKNFYEVTAMQFQMEWDTQSMDLIKVSSFNSDFPFLDQNHFGELKSGQLRFSWLDNNMNGVSMPDSQAIFQLNFLDLPGNNNVIRIREVDSLHFEARNGPVPVLFEKCDRLTSTNKNSLTKPLLYPNPLKTGTEIFIQGISPSAIIRVYSISGTLIETHTVQSISHLSLPSGTYHVNILQDSVNYNQVLLVM